jgi:hypothetical protein
MKTVLVSAGNFQNHILEAIRNLRLFGNSDITVITEKRFFEHFDDTVTLVDTSDLDANHFDKNSQLDRTFRDGFWHLCSLRIFYLYSYIKINNLKNIIHIENDVMVYTDLDVLAPSFQTHKVYAAFDTDTRVVPDIIFIPSHEALCPIINQYDYTLHDMANLGRMHEHIEPFPIFPIYDTVHFVNKNYTQFKCIFDTNAIGQYLGGVDSRNNSKELREMLSLEGRHRYDINDGDTRGFVNETCIVKYDMFKFFWVKNNKNLYVPHMYINNTLVPIINLHIHSKKLYDFRADEPTERLYIQDWP